MIRTHASRYSIFLSSIVSFSFKTAIRDLHDMSAKIYIQSKWRSIHIQLLNNKNKVNNCERMQKMIEAKIKTGKIHFKIIFVHEHELSEILALLKVHDYFS